jgi:regulator of RNase E activity RraB
MKIEQLKKQTNTSLYPLANDGSYDACMVLAHRYKTDASNEDLKVACKFFSMGHEIEKNTGVNFELGFSAFECARCFQRLNDVSSASKWFLNSGREGNVSGFFRAALLQKNIFGNEARKILKEGMEKGSLPCELKYIALTAAEANYLGKIYWHLRMIIPKIRFIRLRTKDEYSFRVRV